MNHVYIFGLLPEAETLIADATTVEYARFSLNGREIPLREYRVNGVAAYREALQRLPNTGYCFLALVHPGNETKPARFVKDACWTQKAMTEAVVEHERQERIKRFKEALSEPPPVHFLPPGQSRRNWGSE